MISEIWDPQPLALLILELWWGRSSWCWQYVAQVTPIMGTGRLEKPGDNIQPPRYLVTCFFQLCPASYIFKTTHRETIPSIHQSLVGGISHPNCEKNCMCLSIWHTHSTSWNYSPLSFDLSFCLALILSIVLRTSLSKYIFSSSTYNWCWFI